jgi:hypothetical protein
VPHEQQAERIFPHCMEAPFFVAFIATSRPGHVSIQSRISRVPIEVSQ